MAAIYYNSMYRKTALTFVTSFPMALQTLVGKDLLIIEASRSHSNTPHSVELLWTSNQPVAETSTWKHTTLTRNRYPCPGGIRAVNPSKRAPSDPRLRPRGHWNLPTFSLLFTKICVYSLCSTDTIIDCRTLAYQIQVLKYKKKKLLYFSCCDVLKLHWQSIKCKQSRSYSCWASKVTQTWVC